MPVLESKLDPRDATFEVNRDAMAALVADLRAKVEAVEQGGGAAARAKHLARDFLRPQMLLDGQRVVGAALDGRVVADNHAFAAGNAADAGDDPCSSDRAVVHPVGGELRELEERRTGVDQGADALARQQLAARDVLRTSGGAATLLDRFDLRPQIRDQRGHRIAIPCERRVARIKLGFERGHGRRGVSSARALRAAPRAARRVRRWCW